MGRTRTVGRGNLKNYVVQPLLLFKCKLLEDGPFEPFSEDNVVCSNHSELLSGYRTQHCLQKSLLSSLLTC